MGLTSRPHGVSQLVPLSCCMWDIRPRGCKPAHHDKWGKEVFPRLQLAAGQEAQKHDERVAEHVIARYRLQAAGCQHRVAQGLQLLAQLGHGVLKHNVLADGQQLLAAALDGLHHPAAQAGDVSPGAGTMSWQTGSSMPRPAAEAG